MGCSRLVFAPLVALPLFFTTRANAQEAVTIVNDPPPAAEPAPAPAEPAQIAPQPAPYERTTHGTNGEIEEHGDGPLPRRGFQMSIRTGYSLPFGMVGNGVKLSDVDGGEVPFLFDIGAKVSDYIFLGGYAGFSIGGCGNYDGNDCVGLGLRLGPEIIVSILPGGRVDPWVGYGIGLELGGNGSNSGNDAVDTFGWEIGHFMGGVDFRVTRTFGIGPFVDFGVGEYTALSLTLNNQQSDIPITEHAFHEWLTLGARFVILP
ncbi:MAG: hypothetical protein ACRELY_17695 [Polyangiaceae bacterium]